MDPALNANCYKSYISFKEIGLYFKPQRAHDDTVQNEVEIAGESRLQALLGTIYV